MPPATRRPALRHRLAGLVLAGLIAALPGAGARADVEAGRAAFRAGDLPGAFRAFEAAARGGNAEAQYLAGQMLANGQGTGRDVPAALTLLEQAAASGHVGAQMMAGTLYAFGDGVPVDFPRALKYLRPAAEAGDPLAQNNLAVLSFYGLGTPPDPVDAYGWVLRAERQGLVQAVAFRAEVEQALTEAQRQEGIALAARSMAQPQPQPIRPSAALEPEAETRVPSTMQAEALPPLPAATEPPSAPITSAGAAGADQPARPTRPSTPPPPPPADPAPPAPSVSEPARQAATVTSDLPWSVQVGALPSRAEAEKHWGAIARRQSALLSGQPMEFAAADLGDKGVFHRILVGRFPDRTAAQAFCDRLKAAGQDCLIRKR